MYVNLTATQINNHHTHTHRRNAAGHVDRTKRRAAVNGRHTTMSEKAAAAAATPHGSGRKRARPGPPLFLREDLDLQGPYVPRGERMQPAPWAGGFVYPYLCTLRWELRWYLNMGDHLHSRRGRRCPGLHPLPGIAERRRG